MSTPPSSFTPPERSLQPSPQTLAKSPFERFLTSFLQEHNIRWMLVIGAAIVFGSSLMLVTKSWSEWSPTLKYLTILGYTVMIYLAGEVSRSRLRLATTHRVLQALTVLLMPVCFLYLGSTSFWGDQEILATGAVYPSIRQAALLLPSTVVLWVIASRILDDWLQGRQTTFLISFTALALAGALPAMPTASMAMAFAIGCWGLVSAGIMKVTRHLFWLAQQQRFPRVFGFLPVAMLGLQFIVLTGMKTMGVLPIEWLGFVLVLTAGTILQTARMVADVFRRRTGDLVRPLPWPIVAPLMSGLVITVLGVALSVRGFSLVGDTTYALVPTSLIAAGLFSLAVRHTRHPLLVWASIACVVIAYQSSPVLVGDLVKSAKAVTAAAINREPSQVPLSLYGLTYLPLLAAMSTIGGYLRRRKQNELAAPLQQFVTIASLGLSAYSAADLTSLFLVSLANVIAFAAYAACFQDRRYLIGSSLSLVACLGSLIPAGNQMGYWTMDVGWSGVLLAATAGLMTLSRLPDRMIDSVIQPFDPSRPSFSLVQWTGGLLAGALAGYWMVAVATVFWLPLSAASLWQLAILLAVAFVFVIRHPSYLSGGCFWGLVGFSTMRWALGADFDLKTLAIAATGCGLVCSELGDLLSSALAGNDSRRALLQNLGWIQGKTDPSRYAGQRPRRHDLSATARRVLALSVPLGDLGKLSLALLATTLLIPGWLAQHAFHIEGIPFHFPGFGLTSLAFAVWLFALVVRRQPVWLAGLTAGLIPIACTSAMLSLDLPLGLRGCLLVWAAAQSLLIVGTHLAIAKSFNQEGSSSHFLSMRQVAEGSLFALVLISCIGFDWVLRIPLALLLITQLTTRAIGSQQVAGTKNIQLADRISLLQLAGYLHGWMAIGAINGCTGFFPQPFAMNAHPSLLVHSIFYSAVSVVVIDWFNGRHRSRWTATWRASLCSVVFALLAIAFGSTGFMSTQVVVICAAIGLLVCREIRLAVLTQHQSHVFIAAGWCGMASSLLLWHRVMTIGDQWPPFAILALGVVALAMIDLVRFHRTLAVFYPLANIVGKIAPMAVVVVVLARMFFVSGEVSILNSLSLMIAAGMYLFQAIQTGHRGYCVPGLVIMNLGLFSLWNILGWTAPELSLVPVGLCVLALVELFDDQLPQSSHNPIRYMAVLTIMCSPLFEVLGGSWIHMLVLMLLSVIVVLLAIGMRLRCLVFAGSAFLLADLVAMVVRSTIDNPSLLWIGGVLVGAAVIALAAACENHRDQLLSRIRILSAELATWK